ncbi:MAG: hypothetical protein KGL79_05330 [Acidobacteriota bacterium]|nr:hypothetical protein [Acidobacteriota bacterium]
MSEDLRPPLTTTTSLWPAGAVLGLALIVLVGFMLVNVIASPRVQRTPTTVAVVVGGLALSPTSPARQLCNATESIPANVLSGLVNPVNSVVRRGGLIINQGAGDFDCVEPFSTSDASPSAILGFYEGQLTTRGWSLFSQGTSSGAPQSLFQKAGSDGFYWIIGVTVTGHGATSTSWKLRLYQNSETI